MKNKLIHIISITALVIMSGMAVNADNTIKVRAIEFKGLKYITKYEILKSTRVKADKGGIVIDVESLKKSLKNIALIKKYKVAISNGKMKISIVEKKPHLYLAVRKGKRIIPFEIDGNNKIISMKRIYHPAKPVIVIDDNEIIKGKLSKRARGICRLAEYLSKSEKRLYNEINEIFLTVHGKLKVKLNGRRTIFYLNADRASFIRLKYITGYMDRKRYYSDKLNIMQNEVYIR
ncbi:hypothetical protein ACFL20_04165 [Spirochaetota bacterium]